MTRAVASTSQKRPSTWKPTESCGTVVVEGDGGSSSEPRGNTGNSKRTNRQPSEAAAARTDSSWSSNITWKAPSASLSTVSRRGAVSPPFVVGEIAWRLRASVVASVGGTRPTPNNNQQQPCETSVFGEPSLGLSLELVGGALLLPQWKREVGCQFFVRRKNAKDGEGNAGNGSSAAEFSATYSAAMRKAGIDCLIPHTALTDPEKGYLHEDNDTGDSSAPSVVLVARLRVNLPAAWTVGCTSPVNMPRLSPYAVKASRDVRSHQGLINQGATCYLSSLLQVLFHITAFRIMVYASPVTETELLALRHAGQRKNPSSPQHKSSVVAARRPIAAALQRLFYTMQFTEAAASTTQLTSAFGWGAAEVAVQHDIQEMFRVLSDALSSHSWTRAIVERLFGGVLVHRIRCTKVDYVSTTEELFHDIQLGVVGNKNLSESLKQLTAEENLEGANAYSAEGHGKQPAVKGAKFKSLPPVLTFHLCRFVYDMYGGQKKVNDHYEFPVDLDMAPYVDTSSEGSDEGNCENQEGYTYALHSVVVHQGNATGGHYYVYIRPKLGEDRWLKFNDSVVSAVSASEAISGNYGGKKAASGASAYMLVYIRTSAVEYVQRPLGWNDVPAAVHDRYSATPSVLRKRQQMVEAHKNLYLNFSTDTALFAQKGFVEVSSNGDDFDGQHQTLKVGHFDAFGSVVSLLASDSGIPVDDMLIWLVERRMMGGHRPTTLIPTLAYASESTVSEILSFYLPRGTRSNEIRLALFSKKRVVVLSPAPLPNPPDPEPQSSSGTKPSMAAVPVEARFAPDIWKTHVFLLFKVASRGQVELWCAGFVAREAHVSSILPYLVTRATTNASDPQATGGDQTPPGNTPETGSELAEAAHQFSSGAGRLSVSFASGSVGFVAVYEENSPAVLNHLPSHASVADCDLRHGDILVFFAGRTANDVTASASSFCNLSMAVGSNQGKSGSFAVGDSFALRSMRSLTGATRLAARYSLAGFDPSAMATNTPTTLALASAVRQRIRFFPAADLHRRREAHRDLSRFTLALSVDCTLREAKEEVAAHLGVGAEQISFYLPKDCGADVLLNVPREIPFSLPVLDSAPFYRFLQIHDDQHEMIFVFYSVGLSTPQEKKVAKGIFTFTALWRNGREQSNVVIDMTPKSVVDANVGDLLNKLDTDNKLMTSPRKGDGSTRVPEPEEPLGTNHYRAARDLTTFAALGLRMLRVAKGTNTITHVYSPLETFCSSVLPYAIREVSYSFIVERVSNVERQHPHELLIARPAPFPASNGSISSTDTETKRKSGSTLPFPATGGLHNPRGVAALNFLPKDISRKARNRGYVVQVACYTDALSNSVSVGGASSRRLTHDPADYHNPSHWNANRPPLLVPITQTTSGAELMGLLKETTGTSRDGNLYVTVGSMHQRCVELKPNASVVESMHDALNQLESRGNVSVAISWVMRDPVGARTPRQTDIAPIPPVSPSSPVTLDFPTRLRRRKNSN